MPFLLLGVHFARPQAEQNARGMPLKEVWRNRFLHFASITSITNFK
jgi:hypothetical protein